MPVVASDLLGQLVTLATVTLGCISLCAVALRRPDTVEQSRDSSFQGPWQGVVLPEEDKAAWPSSARSPKPGTEYWIETLVFVDHTVRQRFTDQADATDYVITLLTMTDNLFHHPSLGVNLSLVIRDIIWIDETQSNELLWGPSLIRSVHRFCNWAVTHYYVRYNYDHALLLSRNIVQAAGISPLSQMCHMQYTCTLAEDSGFFSAYPIAHEMMHSLGVEHDGEGNSCDQSGLSGNIMAPLILSASQNHHWSECTRLMLLSAIQSQTFACLRDFPVEVNRFQMNKLPGWRWSLDEQCFILVGATNSKYCPGVGEDLCQELWCSTTGKPDECDRMLNHGLLDGTPCGATKQCINGRCIFREPLDVKISGIWGPFGSWTTCSRSCGVGTCFRTRQCLSGQNGTSTTGVECKGDSIEYALCNRTQHAECSRILDYREEQCRWYDQFTLYGKYHSWLPQLDPKNPCQLSCFSRSTRQVLAGAIPVRDGTPCSYDKPDSYCIQSICVSFDCLGVRNGKAERDHCGICQGDGSTCRLVHHEVNRSLSKREGRRIIYLIPRNARQLKVFKRPGPHLLSLFDMLQLDTLTSGKELRENTTLKRVYFGTEFAFHLHTDQHGATVQQITASGPVLGDAAIKAFKRRDSMNSQDTLSIHISYSIPVDV